ncbi:MAG: hypothetical protein ABIR62_05510, partial [Dokdonella sp.]|uniref:hypothetical protein n=1 Tax=Dokdonella sp. TaxID=2291710 RepID=UPI0032664502
DAHLDDALRAVREANMQRRLDMNAKNQAGCAMLQQGTIDHWLDPIELAANAGSIPAMEGYARYVLAEYDSVDAIVSDVDTAIERRDKARVFVKESLRLGDANALAVLARAYSAGSDAASLYPVDPAKAYAYAYAGTLAGLGTSTLPSWTLSDNAELLDAHQLGEAEAAGRRIYAQCCLKH